MIAALFVEKDGPYFGLEGVDPWDRERDARNYSGPYPVVAHSPCERWGNYAEGGPNPQAVRRVAGDDKGCFDRALWAVRNFGGVLEHPANSKAFRYYRRCSPEPAGKWHSAGDGFGAWVCQVHQGHYGHPADKATWLYAKAPRDALPELIWGPAISEDVTGEGETKSQRTQARAVESGLTSCEWLSHKQRKITPAGFREVLLSIARGAA